MKNKLSDLNDHLFAQMERISDEDLTSEDIEREIKRSKAISGVAQNIILNARLALDAMKAVNDGLIKNPPSLLGVPGYEEE